MSEAPTTRVIRRQVDGRWVVCVETSLNPLSFHDRKSDALARVTTVLTLGGGGHWKVVDEHGDVLEEGQVVGDALDAALGGET